jgi:hypothetical protein
MTCTTATSSAANNSTLAKRAIVGLLNHGTGQPTQGMMAKLQQSTKSMASRGTEEKLCPRLPRPVGPFESPSATPSRRATDSYRLSL